MKARIVEVAGALADEMGEVDDSNALSWLDAIETESVEIADAIQVAIAEQRAERTPEIPDASTCPNCGKEGRRRPDRERELLGRRGSITLQEPEYFCPCCRKAFFPSDPSDRRGS